MLDPWIIEQIRRREEQQREEEQSRQIEIQIEMPDERDRSEVSRERHRPKVDRGIAIIDFSV